MKEPKDYLIFPLDVPDYDKAMDYVDALKDHVGLFKVGLELFISQGPRILESITHAGGAGIFLDLKLHDIPATVTRAFLAASTHRPAFVTVHCDGGRDILTGVAEHNPAGTRILAVTVLTSINSEHLSLMGYRQEYVDDLSKLVLLKARLARDAGCHGIVCSGHEVANVKRELGPDLIVVTPGIRPAWSLVGKDDQQRVVTPKTAIERGADYLVVGRPIRDAPDPAAAASKVVEEIESAL